MVQGDGRLHKEDVERWYREMVNYIKKLCGDEMVQGNGKLHKKDMERWYRAGRW